MNDFERSSDMAATDYVQREDLDELAPMWRDWVLARPPARVVHLDTAAAGRCSTAVLAAAARHALEEAVTGAYVAESMAEPVLSRARKSLAELMGMTSDGVALVESASAGRDVLIDAWRLGDGDSVAIVPSEWGPNLAAFGHRHLAMRQVEVEGDGSVDLAALEVLLHADPPTIVHLTQTASHRALVQPVADVARLCTATGVPLWVDAAQALGHADVATGADVVYATSRKWLSGPRGVGMIGVAERHWSRLEVVRRPTEPDGSSPVRHLESHEANVAGRIGLAVALAEHEANGGDIVRRRLREVGYMTRTLLEELPGWEVQDHVGAASATTALRATAGQDVFVTSERLLVEHRILTTAGASTRAPREMTTPLLRISPHVDCTPSMVQELRDALTAIDRTG